MWSKLPFESKMEESLKGEFGEQQGSSWFTKYCQARDYLINNVYEQIRGTEPNMSDHGARHVANVLKNINLIIDNDYNDYSAMNLYCLGLMALFHDVGNIKGRKDHNNNIAEVYNEVRNKKPEFNQERLCVINAAKAHTGFNAKDGTSDTLRDVNEIDHIDGNKIQLRELASILRLADECAEGNQRTSDYMLKTEAYSENSIKYHEYASLTSVLIDSGGGRIVLTYNIDVTKERLSSAWVENMLPFIAKRVIKLDIERRYCKNYTQRLYKFKKTEATINFSNDGIPLDLSIGPIVLCDQFPLPLREEEINIRGMGRSFDTEQISEFLEALKLQIGS